MNAPHLVPHVISLLPVTTYVVVSPATANKATQAMGSYVKVKSRNARLNCMIVNQWL